jgi:hypothetical protein
VSRLAVFGNKNIRSRKINLTHDVLLPDLFALIHQKKNVPEDDLPLNSLTVKYHPNCQNLGRKGTKMAGKFMLESIREKSQT